MGLAQLITGSGGYAATVGGTVRVIGSNDVDVISLADIAGKISFDGSFNRGGDFIVLPNAAKTYSIVRASSSITLSDADNAITIPVGSKGTTLQFSDGELVLKFDGQIMIGSQIVTTASAAIATTLSPKTALPAATSASGTLLMAADEPVTVGGNVRVVGTNGSDTVTAADVAGNISFDGSFNRGGDKIVVGKFAENYSAARPNASNVTIGDSDTKLTIPLGSKGLSVQFSNEERTIIYGNGSAYIGSQTLSSSANSLLPFEKNLHFTSISNAFDGTLPYGKSTYGPMPNVIDVNGDGYKDLIFLFSENIYTGDRLGEVAATAPANSQIRIFINQNGRGFKDETSKFINDNYVDGNANKSYTYDINGDGRLDIIYPTSREDGRNQADGAHNRAKINVLLSTQNSQYKIVQVGQLDWYNDAQAFMIDGKAYFAASGYWPQDSRKKQEFFTFSGNDIVLSDLVLLPDENFQPFRLNWNFEFFGSSAESGNVNTLVNGTQSTEIDGVLRYGFNVYQENAGGEWQKIGQYFLLSEKFVKYVEMTSWTLSKAQVPVFEVGEGIYGVRSPVFGASTSLRLYPDSEPIFVSTFYHTVIKSADITNVTSVNEWDTSPLGRMIGLDASSGIVREIKIQIEGLDPSNLGSEQMATIDFNKDGYDDIVLYQWNKQPMPTIFINQKDGTFYAYKPNITELSERYESIIDDFNNDGLPDIVAYIADGQTHLVNVNMSTFLYFTSSTGYFG